MKLVLIDTSGIQKFIFGSNRLRENIGASYLVAMATRDWFFESLLVPNNLIFKDDHWEFDRARRIEDGEISVEVVYAGGGNTVCLFRDELEAANFVRRYTKRILCDAPGLQVHIVARDFDWNLSADGLRLEIQKGLQELSSLKRREAPSQPLLGLGVTRSCHSTGLPAVGQVSFSNENGNIHDASQEILRKHEILHEANRRLRKLLPTRDHFSYPTELDRLGRTPGEFSYIAVVHIDGNGMGQRISDVGKGRSHREFINCIRDFSEALNMAGIETMRATIDYLTMSIDSEQGLITDPTFPHKSGRTLSLWQDGGWQLPIRPVIYGGDDVAFACDGRIAISLALEYIRQFEILTAKLPDDAGAARCCAGIAIVKSHYPFARAYALSEQLCIQAKRFVREAGHAASAIDWHFAHTGLSGDLDDIRQREMVVRAGELHFRPVFTSMDRIGVRTWPTFENGLRAFRDSSWIERRNKMKSLLEVLRAGPNATEAFCNKYQLSLPDLGLTPSTCTHTGWWQEPGYEHSRCVYFDMLELVDFNIPLLPQAPSD